MVTPDIARAEWRLWRAVVFGLAVLAQLLVPAIVMRAQAVAGEICVVDSGDPSDSSKGHAHEQQCAHCRLHDCSAVTPPAVSVVAVARIDAAAPLPLASLAARAPGRRAQPPPTGPPAL